MKKIINITLFLSSFFIFSTTVEAIELDNTIMILTNTCNSLLGDVNNPDSFASLLVEVFDIIKFIAPVLVLVLSSYEYAKAALASDADEIKKVTSKTGKRIIYVIVLFLIPSLLEFVLELLDYVTCDIG